MNVPDLALLIVCVGFVIMVWCFYQSTRDD
jgi:hypothetical protein